MVTKVIAALVVAVAVTGAGLFYAEPGLFSHCPLSGSCPLSAAAADDLPDCCGMSKAECSLTAGEGQCPHSEAANTTVTVAAEGCTASCEKTTSDALAACMGTVAVSTTGASFKCCAE